MVERCRRRRFCRRTRDERDIFRQTHCLPGRGPPEDSGSGPVQCFFMSVPSWEETVS